MKQCIDFCPVTTQDFDEQAKQCKEFMVLNNIKHYDKCHRVE